MDIKRMVDVEWIYLAHWRVLMTAMRAFEFHQLLVSVSCRGRIFFF